MKPEVLFPPARVDEALEILGKEIHEEFRHGPAPLIVGIQSGGLNVARRLKTLLGNLGLPAPRIGSVDTTLYRDDIHRLSLDKSLLPTDLPVSVEDAAILLVDDVIYTGRSARAAMDALFFLGRPKKIRLAVLVDRGHRELPIQPDYRGFSIKTRYEDEIQVTWDGLKGQVKLIPHPHKETPRE